MRRHWRKTTIALASVAVIASAVASSAAATTEPPTSSAPASTAPAGTEPAGPNLPGPNPRAPNPQGLNPQARQRRARHQLLVHQPATRCSRTTRARRAATRRNTSNIAKLEAPDAQTFVLTLCAPDPAIPAKVAFASLGIVPSEYLENADGLDQRADRHRSVHAQRLGARQPDRARGEPGLLG